MKPISFQIQLNQAPPSDLAALEARFKAKIDQVRADMLSMAGLEQSRLGHAFVLNQETIFATARIQFRILPLESGLDIQVSGEDIVQIWGHSIGAWHMMMEKTVEEHMGPGTSAKVYADDPGFAEMKERSIRLLQTMIDAGQANVRKRRYKNLLIASGMLMIVLLLPIGAVWHLKNKAEEKLEAVTSAVADVEQIIEAQGERIEQLYQAAMAGAMKWDTWKDKLGGLLSSDSTETGN